MVAAQEAAAALPADPPEDGFMQRAGLTHLDIILSDVTDAILN
jgi:hypothetical protein